MCHYKKPTYVTWLEQIEQFVNKMNTPPNIDTPYFSFTFISEYTHDSIATPPGFDQRLRDLLSTFENKGYLDDTLLIVYGDHGNRLSAYSIYTKIGRFERKQQFVGMRLPSRFKNTPYLRNLEGNRDKLLTFFDIHQTLRHFLHMNEFNLKASETCRRQFKKNLVRFRNLRGISLFEKVAERNCRQALLPEKYCPCTEEVDISESDFIKQTGNRTFQDAASLVVAYINEEINGKSRVSKSKCMKYKLANIKSVTKLKVNNAIRYKCTVVVNPGMGIFEAWLKVKKSKNDQTNLVLKGPPERLNKYGKQSQCIGDSFYKRYCYCKNSVFHYLAKI